MPMQRWIASAAGGTSQRLNPGLAMMRSRERSPGARCPTPTVAAAIARFSPSPVLSFLSLRGYNWKQRRSTYSFVFLQFVTALLSRASELRECLAPEKPSAPLPLATAKIVKENSGRAKSL